MAEAKKPAKGSRPEGVEACGDCGQPATTRCEACQHRPLCARCYQVHDPAFAWPVKR